MGVEGVEDDDGEEYDDVLEAYLADQTNPDTPDDESSSEDNIKEHGTNCESVGASDVVHGCIEGESEGHTEMSGDEAQTIQFHLH